MAGERALIGAIGIVLLLPLLLTLLQGRVRSGGELGGVTAETRNVPFSWSALRSGEFQKSKAREFDERFEPRKHLIRYTNELWFVLFRDSSTVTSNIAVGPGDALFEKAYLREYFIERTDKQTLAPWVKDLSELQAFCRSRGIGFVVVVSPSKAALFPEDTPVMWRRWYDPRPRGYVQLVEHFRAHGIAFVDAPAILAKQKAETPPALPLFPKGGTHWSARGAWLITNAIQLQFREQEKATEPLEIEHSFISKRPSGEDADLFRLMNLARAPREPTEKLTIRPSVRADSERLKMAVIGGSFCWAPIRQLKASRQFTAIDFFFYYNLFKWREADDVSGKVRTPAVPLDFDHEVFGLDCLLLEINEASSLYPEHHLSAFLKDALAHLRGSPTPR